MSKKCPICKKDVVKEFIPFCSERCQQVDLGRWFNEAYTVPVMSPEGDSVEDQEYESEEEA